MKTSLKVTLTILVVCAMSLAYGIQHLRMEFAEGADYTEQDKQEYDFYTPKLLENMPRITNNFNFHYSNVSGTNPALIFNVRFIGITDTEKIDSYLEKQGYKKGSSCSFGGDCWNGNDPDITVSVESEKNPSAVLVSRVEKEI